MYLCSACLKQIDRESFHYIWQLLICLEKFLGRKLISKGRLHSDFRSKGGSFDMKKREKVGVLKKNR